MDIGRLEWNETCRRFEPALFYNSSRNDVRRTAGRRWTRFAGETAGFALVLLDLTMPLMVGPQTIRELKAIRPEVS